MTALLLFAPAAGCAGGDTPTPDAEAPTEDQIDADLVPGDASNGVNTDPGGAAPGAAPDAGGTDPEDQIGEGAGGEDDETGNDTSQGGSG